jgi:formylglycine-generating enzyme required for sulfatase activity
VRPSPPIASAALVVPAATAVASVSSTPAVAPCPPGMLLIPGGSFFMGSDDGLALEKPAHQVVLAPYCVDEFEVTVDKYKACSDAGRCKRAGMTNDWPDMTDKERRAFDPLCNSRDPVGRGQHPVNCVDWEMANKFCAEQGQRLPTEAEWEFSARGPDGRKYPWGDDDPGAGRLNACGKECLAWGQKNGVDEKAMYDADDGFPNTAPVGSFPKGASRYGVQDVVGNVWEWVSDWYGEYGKAEQKAPAGPAEGTEKIIRGGSWNGSYASWVRPTFRYKDSPAKRSYGIGFRCAK